MVAAALILYGIAFLCFLAAAGNVASRVNLLAAGLACCALYWFLSALVPLVS
ncbi:hypothetical protein ACFPJ1_40780 [Kribbella qitaiheensis]|uniref:hypothetical protein n=1 Tax=Kribbella qitaiheensis TaxID=1544730 RepID=UPI003615E76F